MARLSESEFVTVVTDAITAAGGEIGHNALMDALQAAGAGQMAPQVYRLVRAGHVVAAVNAGEPPAGPVLVYTLPN